VPPRGSGWVRRRLLSKSCACTHPLPRGGTDPVQAHCVIFKASRHEANMSDEPNRIPDNEVDRLLAEQKRAQIVRQRNLVLIVGSGLVVVLLVGLVVWRLKKSATEKETDVTPVVSVKVVKAEKEHIAAPVSAVGTIWPREKADVAAKIS